MNSGDRKQAGSSTSGQILLRAPALAILDQQTIISMMKSTLSTLVLVMMFSTTTEIKVEQSIKIKSQSDIA